VAAYDAARRRALLRSPAVGSTRYPHGRRRASPWAPLVASALALCLPLLLPATAPAATAEVVDGQLLFTAGEDEHNVVRLSGSALEQGFRLRLTDSGGAPLSVGPGCASLSLATVSCEAFEFRLLTGNGADAVGFSGVSGGSALGRIDAGPDADRVTSAAGGIDIRGGPGDDVLVSRSPGGGGALRGGSGNDRLVGRAVGARRALPGSGGVLVVGDSLEVLTKPYLPRHLRGVPLTHNAVGGYSSPQIFKLFENSYDPSQSVIVFDAGTNDNADYPQILAGRLKAVAERVGARCMVVPTIHRFTYKGTFVDNRRKNRVVRAFAASRPGTQTPDWAEVAATRPDLMQPDRLHPNSKGADVRARLIAEGVQACLGGTQLLFGGSGEDRLEGGDVLFGGGGDDRLNGQAGADRLRGEDGDDRLIGGSGRDRFAGGRGLDAINSRRGDTGGASEPVACGPGLDRVTPNGRDRIARTCNLVADPVERIAAFPRQTPEGLSFRLRCKHPDGCRGSIRLRRVGRRVAYARASYRLSVGDSKRVRLPLDLAVRRKLARRGGVGTRIATGALAYTAVIER
jgi:hemolysin type calcium-binding protein